MVRVCSSCLTARWAHTCPWPAGSAHRSSPLPSPAPPITPPLTRLHPPLPWSCVRYILPEGSALFEIQFELKLNLRSTVLQSFLCNGSNPLKLSSSPVLNIWCKQSRGWANTQPDLRVSSAPLPSASTYSRLLSCLPFLYPLLISSIATTFTERYTCIIM